MKKSVSQGLESFEFFWTTYRHYTPTKYMFSESWPIEESKTGRKTKALCGDQKLSAHSIGGFAHFLSRPSK